MKPWIHHAGMLLAPCIALCACATPASAPASAQNALTPAEAAAGWQLLFDGNTLDGWRVGENPESFTVRDGSIVVKGPRAHLFYTGPVENHDFRDFELQLDVKTFPGANSGVYFHTAWQESGWPAKGYEAQVNNSQSDPSRTAGLYAVDDNLDVPATDGQWFTLAIRVEGKRVTTSVDGKRIVDYTEESAPQRRQDMQGRLLSSGTFALQAHDPGSEVHYRNIKVRPLPAAK